MSGLSTAPAAVVASPVRGRIPVLDGLRGFAVIAVMLFHFTAGWRYEDVAGRVFGRVAHAGWIGVDLFFVLSGFLITGILWDAKGTAGYFKNFYARRILRIFPLYFTVLALLALVTGLAVSRPDGVRDFADRQHWLWWYGANLLISWQEKWVFSTPWFSANHFWSLAVEEHFYLVWPLLIAICTYRRALWLCGACILLAVFARLGILGAGYSPKVNYVFTLCRIDALALGSFVALACRDAWWRSVVCRLARPALILGGVVLLWFWLANGLSRYQFGMQTIGYPCLAMTFAAVIVLGVSGQLPAVVHRGLEHPSIRFFGHYSYALYIFHRLIGETLAAFVPWTAISHAVSSPFVGRTTYLAIGFGVTVLLAQMSWHVVESPFLRLKVRYV